MPVLMEQKLEGVTQEMYDTVNKHLDPEADPPAGLIVHVSGPADGGWRIVDVWESADAYQRFTEERLRPAVMAAAEELGVEPRDPETSITEVYDVIRP